MAVYLDTAANTDPGFGVGDGLDACGLIIEKADAVTTYFDGSFAATTNKTYAWSGAVNQSASTETTTYTSVAGDQAPTGEPRGTAVEPPSQRSHNNAYGFPVPDDTDPYRNTWSAINALGTAIEPKLATQAIQFVDSRTLNHDANGDAVVDLSTKFKSITAVVCSSAGPPAWDPAVYQWVKVAGEYNATGKVRIRALKHYGADGAVIASNSTHASLVVQGVPK